MLVVTHIIWWTVSVSDSVLYCCIVSYPIRNVGFVS